MKNFELTNIIQLLKTNWKAQISLLFGLLTLGALLLQSGKPNSAINDNRPEAVFLDKMLPPGQRMAPLEAQNIESLEKVMGQTAVVTLFNSETNAVIASGIKVMRAPQSPTTILYVSPIGISQKISMMREKLIAVLQNPDPSVGADFVRKKTKTQRLIILN